MSNDIRVKLFFKPRGRHGRSGSIFLQEIKVGLVPNRGESVDISDWIDTFPSELDEKTCDQILAEPLYVEAVHTVLKQKEEYVCLTLEFYGDRRNFARGRG